MLLRYTVMQCGAKAGALLRFGPGGALVQLAHTEEWSLSGDQAVEALWRETRNALAAGEPQCRDELVLWPLFTRGRVLSAVVALAGLAEEYKGSPAHRDLFERLLIEATTVVPRDPLRALFQAVLALARRRSGVRALHLTAR